ncbi:ATP-binding protein [Streptomyces poriticola]|uniref:ATP-binding protein n=1 Tax=Streptomyces poriticola TaxID=3120506 RepID=UPI002FCE1E21
MTRPVGLEPLTLGLPALPKAVPEARRVVREHLRTPCTDVELCVSELLTNVIDHVGEGVPVTLRLLQGHDGRTRVEVTDPDPHAWLVGRRPGEDDETGRGLLLLDALALRWGVWLTPSGKTVWCELPEAAP